jgi:FtsP/CotA-like multicopper oxidase with cupredoxin domain
MKTFLLFFLLIIPSLHARLVEYDLTIAEQKWTPGDLRPVRAITINGGIPGPTIRFKVGDTARIRVHNQMKNEDTSIHWHGLLLPNEQDGVPYVTTPPIMPGTTHTFEFPITHSGTYWYHSHTGLQEQVGVYGSIVIEPKGGEAIKTDQDHVVVLSDWTLESGEEVMRSLARGTEWYSFKKSSTQSLLGAAKAGALKDFWARERTRMPAMDISDVAYDAFLVNGKRSIHLPGKPGETVRLRFINAAASTYFYLQSATGPLRIVAADGPAVQPIQVKRLLIGMAETYDVTVKIPLTGKWEIRATSQDGSGLASVWLGEGNENAAPDVPKPNPYNMDAHMMAAIDQMSLTAENKAANMSDEQALAMEPERPLSPYARLRALKSTELPAKLPRRTITLRATGDMARYVWSFNGKTFAEEGVIPIKRGEVIRIEFFNDTMMHHPLHLHGHFFRVLMGQGKYSPLKHTIDLPPMTKRTVEFEANEKGDWLFHCHLLYHMHAGMTRIFSYQGEDWEPPGKLKEGTNIVCNKLCCLPGNPNAATGAVDPRQIGRMPHAGGHDHDMMYLFMEGNVQSHLSEGRLNLRNSKNDWVAEWRAGYSDESEYEIDLAWERYFNPNLSTTLGWRFTDFDDSEDRAFAGVQYRLPYLIQSSLQVDSEGDLRAALGKSLQLTDRVSGFSEVEFDTGTKWDWRVGLEATLTKQFSLITEYHSDYGFGGGIGFRF